MGLFSSSKVSQTTQTTENNQFDQRQVYDAGGGVIGEGNLLDQSMFYDSSNRSTNDFSDRSSSSLAYDASNRSTNDLSDRSTTNTSTNITTVDAGTVALAQRAQELAASTLSKAMGDSYGFATSNNAQAFESSNKAMGMLESGFGNLLDMANDVTKQAGAQAAAAASTANTAYQSAADTSTGNKTLIYVAMAAVALVAAGFIFKR